METQNKEDMKEEIKETELNKNTEKKVKKKSVVKEISPKELAVVNGVSLRISPKNSKFICKMIMKKEINDAIRMLEEVILKKRVVKMNGAEIPHRKGKGVMSGRYPVNAAREIIVLLKQLKANAVINQVENAVITLAIANKATLPFKKEGKRGKRAHIHMEARDKNKIKGTKK